MAKVWYDPKKRTILSKDAIGSMITQGKQGLLSDTELCYLALATTYGLRRVEMTRLKPSSFSGDHLIVDTALRGRKTIHLIPPQIVPYLGSFKHYEADSLTHMLHRMARKCGLDSGAGYGWHSIRRALATELIVSGVSMLNMVRFMRWSDASLKGKFGMLDQEWIDEHIFKLHPFLSYWGNQGIKGGKLNP